MRCDEEDVHIGGASVTGALATSRAAPPDYGSRDWRQDYTQLQLLALLVARQFLRTDYRGVMTLIAEWHELRRTLGLAKVPHDIKRLKVCLAKPVATRPGVIHQ